MSDKKGMIKDAAILLLITVVAGLILGFVYLLFRPYKESKTLSVAAVK